MNLWPFNRRPTAPEPALHPDGHEDGATARQQASEDLASVRSNWPEVHRVARSLRELREHNHFAEQIEHIFQGGRP